MTKPSTIPTFNHKLGLLFLSILTLAACQNFRPATTGDQAQVPATDVTEEATAVAPATAQEKVIEAPPSEPAWQYDINQLLAEADTALAADRLMTPIEDNAFDRYNAVLILQPDNKEAINGLQEIFDRYVLLAQDAMRSGEFGKARALIERARAVNSEAPTIDLLLQELVQNQRKRALARPTLDLEAAQKEVELSVDGLNRRDDAMIEQLQSLAMQVRETDETLLIVARSDAEGRWIYQQMAEGVPDYRLRGDIRLGRTPKVLLLPPID